MHRRGHFTSSGGTGKSLLPFPSFLLLFLLLLLLSDFSKGKKERENNSPKVSSDFAGFLPKLQTTALMGWSRWSEWSKCTAKCGQQGVQLQLRRCLDMYCSGAHSRHRVCRTELKDCPYPSANYSSTPPPLALECALRSSPQNLLLPPPNLPQNCSQLECLSSSSAPFRRLLTFPVPLRDGQFCQLPLEPTQSAVCLHGRCLPVGCDRLVGSRATEDQCGQCGGDGQSCAAKLFRWRDTGHFSPCDKSCGPGSVRVSVSVCMNTHTERVVPERMCADQPRPRPKVRKCPDLVCPENQANMEIEHLWTTGEWADCSVSCGIGEQQREVFCAEQNGQEERRRVAEQYCGDAQSKRPLDVRKCDAGSCPEWAIGDWGQCGSECGGRGTRIRPVECRADGRRFHDWHCLRAGLKKPAREQACWTGTSSCQNGQEQGQSPVPNVQTYAEEEEGDNGIGGQRRPRFLAGAWSECSASCGSGIRSRPVDCMARQAISGQLLKLPDYECQGQSRPPQFQSCQLSLCPPRLGPAPQAIRSLAQPFPPTENGGGEKASRAYRWEHGQWTLCSVSCLGGHQKSPVVCTELATGQPVAWTKCEKEGAGPKPDELVRGCNRHSCPPDWEVGPWSVCSHQCGAGLRTRRVRCVRAVSRTGASTLILPDGQCPGQRPGDEEACGMVDCKPEWTIGHWGQCSVSCGSGEQRRTLSCIRRDAMGQVEERQAEECVRAAGDETPPPTARLCTLGPCPGEQAANFHPPDGGWPLQMPNSAQLVSYAEPKGEREGEGGHDDGQIPPQSLPLLGPAKDQPLAEGDEADGGGHQARRLTLRVGGFANLYEGTSVKVKCPVRAGDRRQVVWTKNGRSLRQSARLKVSQNGALRLFQARQKDAGIYACHGVDGQQRGNVSLRFKPNEGEGGNSRGRDDGKQGTATARQLLQRVRDSLFLLGEHSLYQRLSTIRDPGQIQVDFAASDWGECEQPECAQVEGIQVRLLKCQIHVGSEAAYLKDAICEAFGVHRPASSRTCISGRCPRWASGPWSDCAQSRCVRQGTALQRREVRCAFSNATETSPALCQRKSRPKLKRECQNANCSAEWRPSVWGDCSKKCGDGGVQMRLLRCVWRGTRKPAGPNCEPAERPAAIRACQPKQTLAECADHHEEGEQPNETAAGKGRGKVPLPSPSQYPPPSSAALHLLCEDHSRFCDILRLFQSCDQPRIRAQCCDSCRRLFGIGPGRNGGQ